MAEFTLRCSVPITPAVSMIEDEMKAAGLFDTLRIGPAHRQPERAALVWTASPFWVSMGTPLATFLDVKTAQPVIWDFIDKIRAVTPKKEAPARNDPE